MRDEEIKIGDRLRVRQWEDMAAEYGLTGSGFIEAEIEREDENGNLHESNETFTDSMRALCGHTFTVSEINRYNSFINDYDAEEPEFDDWVIEAWMLEPDVGSVDSDEELVPEEPEGLFGFLLS